MCSVRGDWKFHLRVFIFSSSFIRLSFPFGTNIKGGPELGSDAVFLELPPFEPAVAFVLPPALPAFLVGLSDVVSAVAFSVLGVLVALGGFSCSGAAGAGATFGLAGAEERCFSMIPITLDFDDP